MVHGQVVELERNHEETHAKSLQAIRDRKKVADQRVRQRLAARRKLKLQQLVKEKNAENNVNIFKVPVLAMTSEVAEQQEELSEKDKAYVERARSLLSKKTKSMTRLKKMFLKLDIEHTGMLTKAEFCAMIRLIGLVPGPTEEMQSLLWDTAWEMRKHGEGEEMDTQTLGHWLDLLE